MAAVAVVFPVTIFGAVAVGSAVEIVPIVTFFRILSDAIATAAFNPCAIPSTRAPGLAIVGPKVALFASGVVYSSISTIAYFCTLGTASAAWSAVLRPFVTFLTKLVLDNVITTPAKTLVTWIVTAVLVSYTESRVSRNVRQNRQWWG